MFARRSQPFRSAIAWTLVSALLHLSSLLVVRRHLPAVDGPAFELPDIVEFGIAEAALGGDGKAAGPASAAQPEPAREPPPQPKAVRKPRAPKATSVPAETRGVAVAEQPGAEASDAAARKEASEEAASSAAAVSGLFGAGEGSGSGLGTDGSGTGVHGATIALNVDLDRVRASALLLETQALLEILPEWQALLAGSGLDAVRDFSRVFVAAPSLDRASIIVSAEHGLTRARISAAVGALAAERGSPAPFRVENGFPVAPWRNRGPTERVIALPAANQLLIARATELQRVFAVSRALAGARLTQGFALEELEARGGLLAMQPEEAVALWVEGLRRYVRNGPTGMPDSARLSIFRVDQFNTALAITGNYASNAEASSALEALDALRVELSDHPRVTFLGLKSALDAARIEQHGRSLKLDVRLTLHQTRYLLAFVSRLFRPRAT